MPAVTKELKEKFFRAITTGKLKEVEALIESNPELLQERNEASDSPLDAAYRAGHFSVAEIFYKHGETRYNRKTLYWYAYWGKIDWAFKIINLFLESSWEFKQVVQDGFSSGYKEKKIFEKNQDGYWDFSEDNDFFQSSIVNCFLKQEVPVNFLKLGGDYVHRRSQIPLLKEIIQLKKPSTIYLSGARDYWRSEGARYYWRSRDFNFRYGIVEEDGKADFMQKLASRYSFLVNRYGTVQEDGKADFMQKLVSRYSFKELVKVLANNECLEVLRVQSSGLNNSDLKGLLEALENHPKLQIVDVAFNDEIDSAIIPVLMAWLERNSNIIEVNLDGTACEESRIKDFLKERQHVQRLRWTVLNSLPVEKKYDKISEILEKQNVLGQTILHVAALLDDDKALLTYLFSMGSWINKINYRDHEGNTILHLIAEKGDIALAKELISLGSHVDALNHANETPLLIAARKKHIPMVDYLLECGATLDVKDANDFNAVGYLLLTKQIETLNTLIQCGYTRRMIDFLKYNYLDSWESEQSDDRVFALRRNEVLNQLATNAEHIPTLKILLKHYSEFKDAYYFFDWVMRIAIENNKEDIFQACLFNHPCQKSLRSFYFEIACSKGQLKIAKQLFKDGADPNARPNYYKNVVYWAAFYLRFEALNWLREIFKGKDISYYYKDFFSETVSEIKYSFSQSLVEGLGDRVIKKISDIPAPNILLSSYELTDNKKVINFLKSLATNEVVNELNLDNNRLGKDSGAALGYLLSNNKHLSILNLNKNVMGGHYYFSSGAMLLAKGLEKNRSLTTLHLASNQLDDSDVKALASAIKKHPIIQSIDLSDNQFGDRGIDALVEAAKNHYSLTTIVLGTSRKFSVKNAKILQEELAGNKDRIEIRKKPYAQQANEELENQKKQREQQEHSEQAKPNSFHSSSETNNLTSIEEPLQPVPQVISLTSTSWVTNKKIDEVEHQSNKTTSDQIEMENMVVPSKEISQPLPVFLPEMQLPATNISPIKKEILNTSLPDENKQLGKEEEGTISETSAEQKLFPVEEPVETTIAVPYTVQELLHAQTLPVLPKEEDIIPQQAKINSKTGLFEDTLALEELAKFNEKAKQKTVVDIEEEQIKIKKALKALKEDLNEKDDASQERIKQLRTELARVENLWREDMHKIERGCWKAYKEFGGNEQLWTFYRTVTIELSAFFQACLVLGTRQVNPDPKSLEFRVLQGIPVLSKILLLVSPLAGIAGSISSALGMLTVIYDIRNSFVCKNISYLATPSECQQTAELTARRLTRSYAWHIQRLETLEEENKRKKSQIKHTIEKAAATVADNVLAISPKSAADVMGLYAVARIINRLHTHNVHSHSPSAHPNGTTPYEVVKELSGQLFDAVTEPLNKFQGYLQAFFGKLGMNTLMVEVEGKKRRWRVDEIFLLPGVEVKGKRYVDPQGKYTNDAIYDFRKGKQEEVELWRYVLVERLTASKETTSTPMTLSSSTSNSTHEKVAEELSQSSPKQKGTFDQPTMSSKNKMKKLSRSNSQKKLSNEDNSQVLTDLKENQNEVLQQMDELNQMVINNREIISDLEITAETQGQALNALREKVHLPTMILMGAKNNETACETEENLTTQQAVLSTLKALKEKVISDKKQILALQDKFQAQKQEMKRIDELLEQQSNKDKTTPQHHSNVEVKQTALPTHGIPVSNPQMSQAETFGNSSQGSAAHSSTPSSLSHYYAQNGFTLNKTARPSVTHMNNGARSLVTSSLGEDTQANAPSLKNA